MAAASLNLDELLAEIPGGNPAGESLPYTVRADLEQARKEIDPEAFDADDPARPTEAKLAEWDKVLSLAGRTLQETSKHLELAARMTEALTRLQGFSGLAEGLALLRGMVERCWERMYPDISDGDLEVRAGPFDWLGIGDRGARFPNTVRDVPLVVGEGGRKLGCLQWRLAQEGRGGITKEMFDRAVAAASRDHCQAAFDAVSKCQEEFLALTRVLTDKLGPLAPGLSDLRTALGECYTLAKQILQQKGPAPTAAAEPDATTDGEAPAAGGASNGQASAARAVATREDAYRRLNEAADLLARLEPHSPIPYLVRRAVELGSMPFPLLMRALIRNDDVLTEMNRELGIKAESPPDE